MTGGLEDHGKGAVVAATAASPPGREAKVRIESVRKQFESSRGRSVLAIDHVDLDVAPGEFVSIVGPSGCGKSTLLYILGGFVEATAGRALMNERPVKSPGPERGVVFQEFALFPWLTVAGNVRYGLREQGIKGAKQKEIVDRYLDMVGLGDMHKLYPKELSGGMKQRVALARALAINPEVLLLDEPFGALDALTRAELQVELMRIWEETKKTVILVTHSVEEAIYLSDRVYALSPRPSTVLDVVDIDIPRPRDREGMPKHPSYPALYGRIWDLLQHDRGTS